MTKTIVQQHQRNFETLQRAMVNGDIVLVECTLKFTGEKVAVVCGLNEDGEGYAIVPLAMFFNGNPYELLEPPKAGD